MQGEEERQETEEDSEGSWRDVRLRMQSDRAGSEVVAAGL